MDTVDQLVEKLGGDPVVSQACDVVRNTVTYWRIRDRIPHEYWPALIGLAKERDVTGIDHEALAALSRPRKRRSDARVA